MVDGCVVIHKCSVGKVSLLFLQTCLEVTQGEEEGVVIIDEEI